jgi:hypothetical protein
VTDTQLSLAIGVPIVVNLTAMGIFAHVLMRHTTAAFTGLRADLAARFDNHAAGAPLICRPAD